MTRLLEVPLKDQSGATAIEYGLIVALIAVIIAGAVTTLGGGARTSLTNGHGAITAGNSAT